MKKLNDELLSEIQVFREKGHKFLAGEISVNEFKGISGGMGVYAHRGGKEFMIRLRIPSGIITIPQLELICNWAEKYGLDKLHFTTRQAIQYHGISIDEVCDLMKEALENGIYTRGAGGNFPRNVALSPLSGVDPNEAFDPTKYALAVGNYFMERITSYKLPRKLKVSFSNGENDTAHCTIQDLGFLAVKENNENKFRVYIGGGLGRNPKVALVYPELINPCEVLYYVEAMIRLFKAEGNYENKAKARVRYIVDKLGEEGFIKEYTKYVNEVKSEEKLALNINEDVCNKVGVELNCHNDRLFKQKQAGLYSVYVHPIGGQISVSDLKKISDKIEEYKDVQVRLSMAEGVYLLNLDGNEAEEILKLTENIGGKTSFEYSVSCIGVPTCQMGIAESQKALSETLAYVKENIEDLTLLPRLYFSGCGNSCGVHQIGAIGFTGKKKRVNDEIKEVYELHVGGSFIVGEACLGDVYGDLIREDIPMFITELANKLNEVKKSFNEYLKCNKDDFKVLVDKYKC